MLSDDSIVTPFPSRKRWIVLLLLAIAAAVSLVRGCVNAMASSNDFQWSGSHLLLQHIDPWRQYLLGDPGHLLIRIQIPNYLPLLYILLAPLGILPFDIAKVLWLVLNIFFGVGGALLIGRFYGLRRFGCATLALLLLISTPMRNSLGLGQQSLMIVFLWTVALCRPPSLVNAFTLSFSYFKYSFAPPAFLFLLFETGPVAALLGIIPATIGFLMAYLWLGGSLLQPANMFRVFLSPVKVASDGYFGAPGPNLMDLAEYFLKAHHAPFWLNIVGGYAVPILLAGALLFLFSRQPQRLDRPTRLALLAILSVSLFKHHGYDHVILLFPAAYALRHLERPASRVVLALLAVPWFAERALDRLIPSPVLLNSFNFLVLIAMIAVIYRFPPHIGDPITAQSSTGANDARGSIPATVS